MPGAEISVIILTRGRPELLARCLESLRAAGVPGEVLVGIDGADPASSGVLGKFPGTRAVQLPRGCRGEARNELVRLASGRWLCFLDDDTVLPPGYFWRLRALIEAGGGFSVFGGGQELYSGAGRFERAVYRLLRSRWASGPFTPRFAPVSGSYEAGPGKFVLCNLTLDREFLAARGLSFEGHLSSAEENLLLGRMAADGARMLLSGDLNLVHRRRTSAGAFVRQVFSSGRGRGQITVQARSGFCAFTLLPPAALAAGPVLAAAAPGTACALGLLYLSACAVSAVLSGEGASDAPLVFCLYPALHAAYGAGWIFGALEELLETFRGRARPARCRCQGRP